MKWGRGRPSSLTSGGNDENIQLTRNRICPAFWNSKNLPGFKKHVVGNGADRQSAKACQVGTPDHCLARSGNTRLDREGEPCLNPSQSSAADTPRCGGLKISAGGGVLTCRTGCCISTLRPGKLLRMTCAMSITIIVSSIGRQRFQADRARLNSSA